MTCKTGLFLTRYVENGVDCSLLLSVSVELAGYLGTNCFLLLRPLGLWVDKDVLARLVVGREIDGADPPGGNIIKKLQEIDVDFISLVTLTSLCF